MNERELLSYAAENGMIDLQDLQEKMEMAKRNNILSQYHYWKASDGRWKVYLPDKKKGARRKQNTFVRRVCYASG